MNGHQRLVYGAVLAMGIIGAGVYFGLVRPADDDEDVVPTRDVKGAIVNARRWRSPAAGADVVGTRNR
jgi:hypothetical protein